MGSEGFLPSNWTSSCTKGDLLSVRSSALLQEGGRGHRSPVSCPGSNSVPPTPALPNIKHQFPPSCGREVVTSSCQSLYEVSPESLAVKPRHWRGGTSPHSGPHAAGTAPSQRPSWWPGQELPGGYHLGSSTCEGMLAISCLT